MKRNHSSRKVDTDENCTEHIYTCINYYFLLHVNTAVDNDLHTQFFFLIY